MAGAGIKTFTAGDVLTATQVNTYLMQQSVMVFATAAARTAALPSPSEGMVTQLSDDNRIEAYDGSAWKIVYLPPTSYTPTATNYTRSSGSFVYSVAGHTMTISGSIVVSAVSGAIQVSLPTGFTMSSLVGTSQSVGVARFIVAGGLYHGTARVQSTTSLRLMVFNTAATYAVENDCTNLVPATWASGNSFAITATFPLA